MNQIDKEKAKDALNGAKEKAKAALSEIKANFKADDGTEGVKKYKSMFANLWKSGTTGKATLVAASIVALFLLTLIFGGDEKEKNVIARPHVPSIAVGEVPSAGNRMEAQENKVTETLKVTEARAAQAERDREKQLSERAVSAKEKSEDASKRMNLLLAMRSITDLDSAKRALEAAKSVDDEDAIKKASEKIVEYEREAEEKEKMTKAVAEVESAMKDVKDVASAKRVLELAEKTEDVAIINKAERLLEKQEKIAHEAAVEAKKAAKRAAYEAIPSELAVKGLAIRMSGDAALEACNKLVSAEKDLSVLDYRKGLVREKDDETKAADKKYWDACLKNAEADIDQFLQWHADNSTYVPALKYCVGRSVKTLPEGTLVGCHSLFLQWNKNGKETIPGPNYTVASAMAALAGVYGYQVEWMLVGTPEGHKSPVHKPEPVVIEKLSAKDYLKLGGVGRMSKYLSELTEGSRDWQALEFGDRLYPKVFNNGLQIHKDYNGTVLCRILLLDSKGKPIDKSELATDVACSFPKLVEKANSQAEKLKTAENFVNKVMQWNNGANGYAQIMSELAEHCDISVEWAVLTEPAMEYEQITETFTIPDTTQQGACKFLNTMKTNLGEYSDSTVGSDGSRKRKFFKKNLVDVRSPVWFRLVLKNKNGADVRKEDVVKNWLAARGHYKPSDTVTIPPKNVIKIVIDKKGVAVDKLTGICFAWLDDAGNVKETYFTEEGMARLFDARDLTGEKFADLLVKSYPGLPRLSLSTETTDPGRGKIQDNIWTYECPKGYRVKLFERTYINKDGVKYDAVMLEKDVEVNVALSLADLLPKKFLSIVATKPEAARKFD